MSIIPAHTLVVDRNTCREDALVDIYRVMRPGEPPTLESAHALFQSLFFNSDRYDCRRLAGEMNSRLDLETDDNLRILRKADIWRCSKYW